VESQILEILNEIDDLQKLYKRIQEEGVETFKGTVSRDPLFSLRHPSWTPD
jgi:hypothetical protein